MCKCFADAVYQMNLPFLLITINIVFGVVDLSSPAIADVISDDLAFFLLID